jgi:hypothetical protein
MNYEQRQPAKSRSQLFDKPVSYLTATVAGMVIAIGVQQRIVGNAYLEQLNWIDNTTLIMVGILLLRGVVSRRQDTDLQTAAIALIGVLSFVFSYEAIYKLSFYAVPWRMPPGELREFIIQVAIALTALAGFGFDKFRLSILSRIFAGVFIAGWIVWLLIGFPQLDGNSYYPAIINVPHSSDMVYALNRATKVALCLVYYFLYS